MSAVCLLCALAGGTAAADIVLSSAIPNNALKTLEKLQQTIERGAPAERSEALYRLGMESDTLATLINDEVTAHGMQEKALIDLALSRLKELNIGVAYNREKRQFFYDGDAFGRYLQSDPKGPRAAGAEFKLVEHQFYTSTATDPKVIIAAAERKRMFLKRYPRFESNSQVSLMLAIDYQDLYRMYREARNAAGRDRYAALARRQFQATAREFPRAEEAKVASGLLKRLDAEIAAGRRQR